MNSEILFKNIFDKNLSEDETPAYLSELQNKYPWFALPYFYKLKNTGIGDRDYNKQAALTAQFFPNIYLLNQRLQQKNFIISSDSTAIIPEVQEHEIDEPRPVIEPVTENIPVTQEPETFIPEVQEHEIDVPQPVIEPVTENIPVTKESETIIPEVQEHEIDEPQSLIEPVTENIPVTQEAEPTDLNLPTGTHSSLEKAAADFRKVETDDNTSSSGPILFEPLHATDYFASQGIKLSEDVQSQDKLGKQMKSFTAWLKVMKKTPEQQQGLPHVADEIQIQNLANKSNTEADVNTESMAEVYIQQNKKEKAREIYKKLSLINPDKSAYFAAKIENLNKK